MKWINVDGVKLRQVVFIVILCLLAFYVIFGHNKNTGVQYEDDGTYTIEEKIEAKQFLNKESIIVLFYVLVIIIFRKSLNVDNPNIKSLGRVSLMILSAYFSYLSFIALRLPEFIAVIGGAGFVIGVVEASSNWKKVRADRKNGKVDKIVVLYIFVTMMAMILDMSMSAISFVTMEGKSIVTQKMFAEKRRIEQARADKEALDLIQSLTASGNFANARYHADLYFAKKDSAKSDSNETINQYSGLITSGFSNLLGSSKSGRIATNIFFLLVSCSITLMMVAFDSASNVNNVVKEKSKQGASRSKVDKEKAASQEQAFASNVALKNAIMAQLAEQEKTGHVNKSAIARQMQEIYGKCSRQYVQQVNDDRKSRQIGFGVNRSQADAKDK